MRSPLDVVIRQAAGGVVSSGELYVYERGTKTPAVGYTSEAGGKEVSYPLEPDSEGRFPEAWYEPGSYDLYRPGDAINPTQPWEAPGLPTSVETVSLDPSGGNDRAALQAAMNTYSEVRLKRGATYNLSDNTGLIINPSKCRLIGSDTIFACSEMTEGAAITLRGSTNSYNNGASGGMRGIRVQGPGTASSVTGIAIEGVSVSEATSLFAMDDSVIENFGIGIAERSYAWCVNVRGVSVYNCGKGIDNSAATTEANERMTYIGCNIFNGELGLNLSSSNGEHEFIACSFDFNAQFAKITGHKVFLHGCHVEYTASTTIPLEMLGTRPLFVMNGGVWAAHAYTSLTTGLTSGVAVTELKVAPTQVAIAKGDTIRVSSGTEVDAFTASAAAAKGATTIAVESHAPTHAFSASINSKVVDESKLPEYIVKFEETEPGNNRGAYFNRVPMSHCSTTTGNFTQSGEQSPACYVNPNMCEASTCLKPSNGSALLMPASMPARASVMGPLLQNATAATVSSSPTNIPTQRTAFHRLNVTTKSAFSVTLSESPGNSRSAFLTFIVKNEAGGELGTITWPGAWEWGGYTWANPASGKQKSILAAWNPGTTKWVVVALSADY